MTTSILLGDDLDGLELITDGAVQYVVTSPPYWGQRDYECAGQIGLEATPEEYVAKLVLVFREVRRALADDGVLWCNIADSYTDFSHSIGSNHVGGKTKSDRKNKDLVGLPWMLAFALRADGWWLRSDVIWHKANGQPESVKDRPTRSHEHVFLLTKSARYFYDSAAVAEPVAAPRKAGANAFRGQSATRPRAAGERVAAATRNCRDVWSISARPFADAHMAVMPEELAARCILAGSRPGDLVLDPFLGAGTVGLVANSLGREAVGCELNPAYAEISRQRLRDAGQQAEIYDVGDDLALAA